jgi:tetratricopeptide (TPR) repeat protein
MLSTLFAFGVIAGMVWLNLSGSEDVSEDVNALAIDNQPAQPFSTSLSDEPSAEDTQFTQSAIQLGDRYLIAGNFERAMEHYHDAAMALSPDESSVLLREAFCYELMGKHARAGKKYFRSITTSSNRNHQLLATVGYARSLQNGGYRNEAFELVAEQMLKLNEYEDVPDESRSWLSFVYARLLIDGALRSTSNDQSISPLEDQDLTLPHEVVFDESPISSELFLDVLDQPCETATKTRKGSNTVLVNILQRPADSADLISLSVSANLQPVSSLAAVISRDAGVNLSVSPAAAASIEHRSRTIQLNGTSLSVIFDALFLPFDLVWFQSGSDIQVMTIKEVSASTESLAALRAFRFAVADRSLRSFEIDFQSSEMRHAALLARGNLNLIQKQYDAAANRYQELELALPKDEMLAKLFFNQAKLQRLLNNDADARKLLFMAIDQTVNANLEACGYCLLSSSLLKTLDTDSTVTAARRAIATSVDPRQTRWAVLNLARAYLMANNPFAANDALFRSRDAFLKIDSKNNLAARQRVVASLLGSYARFRGVNDQRRIKTARNRLMSSIAMLDDASFESFSDCYVAARAYQELGFEDKALEKMLLSLARPDVGQWQPQLTFELGQLQERSGNPDDAIKTYQLLTQNNDRWRTLSLERLIKLYADTGQIDKCIAYCKTLWSADLTDEQKRTTLIVLGNAFQKQGEHHSAALCFAGILPEVL